MYSSTIHLLIFLLLLATLVSSDNLLLLGDSIDRYTTIEWCKFKALQGFNTTSLRWGQDKLRYDNVEGVKFGSFYCKADKDSVAFVHIFGSNATGPYHNNLGNNPLDIYEDTVARLNLSISLYQSLYGSPDRVILQTAQWDNHYYRNNKVDLKVIINTFTNNTNLRLNELLQMVDKSVDVGLRTAVWCRIGGNQLHTVNQIIRDIAKERNLTLYDFDYDIRSTINYDKKQQSHILFDQVHPKPTYTARAAEKMLGRQYSNAMTFRHPNRSSDYYSRHFDAPHLFLSTVHIWNDTTNNISFLLNNANYSRHEYHDYEIVNAMRLGPADVRHFSPNESSVYNRTCWGDPILNFLVDGTVLNVTEKNMLFYSIHLVLRPILSLAIVAGLGKMHGDVVQINKYDAYWLSLVEPSAPIPDIYNRTDDWLLRKVGKPTVYLIRNGYRIPLLGLPSLKAVNLTLDDVMSVNEQDFQLVPLSSSSL